MSCMWLIEEYPFNFIFQATRIPFSFVDLASSSERVAAMDDTRKFVASYYKYTDVFIYSESFSNWETDKIVQVCVSRTSWVTMTTKL